jgi:hypothetical protein
MHVDNFTSSNQSLLQVQFYDDAVYQKRGSEGPISRAMHKDMKNEAHSISSTDRTYSQYRVQGILMHTAVQTREP